MKKILSSLMVFLIILFSLLCFYVLNECWILRTQEGFEDETNLQVILNLPNTNLTVEFDTKTHNLIERVHSERMIIHRPDGSQNVHNGTSYTDYNSSLIEASKRRSYISSTHHTGEIVIGTYAILYIPLESNKAFIHTIDIVNGIHKKMYYFDGEVLSNETLEKDIPNMSEMNGKIKTSNTLVPSNKEFLSNHVMQNNENNEKINFNVTTDNGFIFVAGSFKNDSFRVLIEMDLNGIVPKIALLEINGVIIDSSARSIIESSEHSRDSTDTVPNTSSALDELKRSMLLFKEMQEMFGKGGAMSQDYILKTEVVPPVCPQCPSCPSSGVCTDCGGNGGGGSKTNSASSLARDFAGGVNDLVRDTASGTTNLIKNAAGNSVQLGKDIVGGTRDFVTDAAGNSVQLGKDIVGGTRDFVTDAAGNIYDKSGQIIGNSVNLGKDAIQGTVGLGKDIVGGTVGLGKDIVGGLNSRYAGPSAINGGYENSFGGGYLNPQHTQNITSGQNPYSYFGQGNPPNRNGVSNFIPRTADFSSFGK